jgi:hypothetical protein
MPYWISGLEEEKPPPGWDPVYLTLGTVYLILAKEINLFFILLDFHSFL